MHRFADRFTDRRVEINNLMVLQDHALVDYGKYALGCMTGADMKKCVYLKSVRDELLRSMEEKRQLMANYRDISGFEVVLLIEFEAFVVVVALLLLRFAVVLLRYFVFLLLVEVEGDENENVALYYYITDNIKIQFGREEFFLVTGLRFEVENLADYNDGELPIPFRRRVFLSSLDGENITGNMLVLLGVEGKRRIPDWMLRLEQTNQVGWLSGDHMNSWVELLIRSRPENSPWTVAKTGTMSLNNLTSQIVESSHVVNLLFLFKIKPNSEW
ncbi:hypothetical protein Tco_1211446 [Tanacetum coccineum]